MKSLLTLFIASTCSAAPVNFHWVPSPNDTNGSGSYTLSYYQLITITNVPAGQTNAWFDAQSIPGNCYVTAQFTQGEVTSAPCPPYVWNYNLWLGVASPAGLGAK